MNIKTLSLDERAQRAAYLRASFNMSQEEIGSALGGLSQPQVSRLLAHAEKKRYLLVERRFVEDGIPPEALRQIQEMLAPARLTGVLRDLGQALGVRVPNVRVFTSGPGTTPDAMRIRRHRFGRTVPVSLRWPIPERAGPCDIRVSHHGFTIPARARSGLIVLHAKIS